MRSAENTETARTAFGARLYDARKRAGMSQEQVASAVRRLGGKITQTSIQSAETANHSSKQARLLARVLGVRDEWLIDGTGPMLETDSPPRAMENAVKHLPPSTETDFRTVAHTMAAALHELNPTQAYTPREFLRMVEGAMSYLQKDT